MCSDVDGDKINDNKNYMNIIYVGNSLKKIKNSIYSRTYVDVFIGWIVKYKIDR